MGNSNSGNKSGGGSLVTGILAGGKLPLGKHGEEKKAASVDAVRESSPPSPAPATYARASSPAPVIRDDERFDRPRNSTGSRGSSERSSFAADGDGPGSDITTLRTGSIGRANRSARGRSLRPSSFDEAHLISHVVAANNSAGSNRGQTAHILTTVPELELGSHLRQLYDRLCVIQPGTPVPVGVFARLWRVGQREAVAAVEELKTRELLQAVTLDDGTVWATLPMSAEDMVVLADDDAVTRFHSSLVDSYLETSEGGQLHAIPNDGYIWLNLVYHLICGDRAGEVAGLITEPAWLEAKLHAYGVAEVVSDFRRYLSDTEDADTKLLLQAFMLSVGACTAYPDTYILRQQLLGRLMTLTQQAEEGNGVSVKGADRRLSTNSVVSHTWLSAWAERQTAICMAEEHAAAGHTLVHLLPRSASLQQAGGRLRMTLRGHNGPVRRVVISPNGRDVITVSEDGSAQVWDMNVGDCVMQLARETPLTDVAAAPDGDLAVIGSQDGTCCLWDLNNGQIKHVLSGHSMTVNAVAVDRQGIRCVTASDDGTVRVWDIHTGQCEQVLKGHSDEVQGVVFDVAISSDGSLAALVSNDFCCRVYDLDEEAGDRPDALRVLQGHSGWVVSVEFIGTTEEIVTASHDATARVWDCSTGKCLHVLEGHTGRLNKVIVDSGGRYAITCSDDLTARVWDLDDGTCLSTLAGHAAWISAAAITRDGLLVVTVSGDATGFVWSTKTGAKLMELEGHSDAIRSVVTTLHGRFAVTASDDCTVRVWDMQACDVPQAAKHNGRVKQLRSLPDGRRLISIGDDGAVHVWDGGRASVLASVDSHSAGVSYIGTSTDGTRAVTGTSDRNVVVWSTDDGALVSELRAQQGSRVKDMVFDAGCTFAVVLLFDSTVSVIDTASGAVVRTIIGRGDRQVHTSGVNSLIISGDGKTLITCSKDGSAGIWELESGAVLGVVRGHSDGIVCAAISPDGSLLMTGSYDGAVQLSRVPDGSTLLSLTHDARPVALCLSPDCGLLAVALDGGSVVVWALGGDLSIPAAGLSASKAPAHRSDPA
ncbi:hypothetical protein FOA52_009003 [Chlamydomonas sp. UWO 241]|nr:hypothetical protein FOA52_009003 [Chlamydomonas sp. UWO 241]